MTYSCAIYPELDRDLLEEDGREEVNGGLGLRRIVNGSMKKTGEGKAKGKGQGYGNGHGHGHGRFEEGFRDEDGVDDLEEAQIRKLR